MLTLRQQRQLLLVYFLQHPHERRFSKPPDSILTVHREGPRNPGGGDTFRAAATVRGMEEAAAVGAEEEEGDRGFLAALAIPTQIT